MYRRFEEAEPDHPEAVLALQCIGKLYEIDERAGDDLALRGELRRTESTVVLADLARWYARLEPRPSVQASWPPHWRQSAGRDLGLNEL